MAVALWAVRLERALTEQEAAALLRLLPPERKKRLLRLRKTEKRQQVLCAYGLLCHGLRERYGWTALPEIAAGANGKPYFPEYPDVHFNLSHTDGAVLVGLSDSPIGVDIEKLRTAPRRLAAGRTDEAFFRDWVRREAIAKCGGSGIGAALRTEIAPQAGEVYYEVEPFSGYAAGTAVREAVSPGPVRLCSLEELCREDTI